MIPPGPVRLTALFAREAPICILINRRGKRSQLIRWYTNTDVFEPGQWIIGRVDDPTISSDGRYMALGVMGSKPRLRSKTDTQISLVCKPPYFTALELWISGLCVTRVAILADDSLFVPNVREHIVHALNECSLKRIMDTDKPITTFGDRQWSVSTVLTDQTRPARIFDSSTSAVDTVDAGGRRILFEQGKIFAFNGDERSLLFDANLQFFQPIETPGWAKDW